MQQYHRAFQLKSGRHLTIRALNSHLHQLLLTKIINKL